MQCWQKNFKILSVDLFELYYPLCLLKVRKFILISVECAIRPVLLNHLINDNWQLIFLF